MHLYIKLSLAITCITNCAFASQVATKRPLKSCLKNTLVQGAQQQADSPNKTYPPNKKRKVTVQTPPAMQLQDSLKNQESDHTTQLAQPTAPQPQDQQTALRQAPELCNDELQTASVLVAEEAMPIAWEEMEAKRRHNEHQGQRPVVSHEPAHAFFPDAAPAPENIMHLHAHSSQLKRNITNTDVVKAHSLETEQKHAFAQKIERLKRDGFTDEQCEVITNPKQFYAKERQKIEANNLYCMQQLEITNQKLASMKKRARKIEQYLETIKFEQQYNDDFEELLDGLESLEIGDQEFMQNYDRLISFKASLEDLLEKGHHRLEYPKLLCPDYKRCRACSLFDLREHTGPSGEPDVTLESLAEYERIEKLVPAEYRYDFMLQISRNRGTTRRCMEYDAIINRGVPATEELCIQVVKSSKKLCAKSRGDFPVKNAQKS